MFENLRRKSLVKTYIDPIHLTKFEQGHAIYLDSFSIVQHKQRLSTKKTDKSFSSTFDGVSKEFRLIPSTLDKVKFNMLYCSIGTFIMGQEDEQRHETIERPFLLGETEVTQELYEKVMGENPSHFGSKPQNPVECVSWVDAITFCNKLSKLQGLDQCYNERGVTRCDFNKNGYRLPTEKEWEYAAKAGTENRWAGTNDKDALDKYDWFKENSQKEPHRVATKKPNEWGFHDMSGNVSEWCWDNYGLEFDGDEVLDFSNFPIYRGGSWYCNALSLCSATRFAYDRNGDSNTLGFRVCRSFVN